MKMLCRVRQIPICIIRDICSSELSVSEVPILGLRPSSSRVKRTDLSLWVFALLSTNINGDNLSQPEKKGRKRKQGGPFIIDEQMWKVQTSSGLTYNNNTKQGPISVLCLVHLIHHLNLATKCIELKREREREQPKTGSRKIWLWNVPDFLWIHKISIKNKSLTWHIV